MQPHDRREFLEILNGLAAIKPGGKIAKEALSIWWGAMQNWTLEEFRAAANHLASAVEFMPSPYHFAQLRKAGRLTAAEAWERARKACGTAIVCGQVTHNGTCDDVLIDAAVRGIGGYGVIAMTDTDKLPFLERRFAEHYATLEDATDTREALPQLTSGAPRLSGPRPIAELLAGPRR